MTCLKAFLSGGGGIPTSSLVKNWTGLGRPYTPKRMSYIVILIHAHCLVTPQACLGTQAETSLCDHEIALKYISLGSHSLRLNVTIPIVSYFYCSAKQHQIDLSLSDACRFNHCPNITLRKHMNSAFQWAPVCAFLQPRISIQSTAPPTPQPGPVAALPAAGVCSSPNNQPLFSILKAAI